MHALLGCHTYRRFKLYVVKRDCYAVFTREGDGGFINWAYQGNNIKRVNYDWGSKLIIHPVSRFVSRV